MYSVYCTLIGKLQECKFVDQIGDHFINFFKFEIQTIPKL